MPRPKKAAFDQEAPSTQTPEGVQEAAPSPEIQESEPVRMLERQPTQPVPTKAERRFSLHEMCAYALAWGVCKRKKGTPFDNYAKFYDHDEMQAMYGVRLTGETALLLATKAMLRSGFKPKVGNPKEFERIEQMEINGADVPDETDIDKKMLYIIVDLGAKELHGNPFHNGARFLDRDEMLALHGIDLRGEAAVQKAKEWAENQGYRRFVPKDAGGKEEIRNDY